MDPGSVWDLESWVLSCVELNSVLPGRVIELESFISDVQITSTITDIISGLESKITSYIELNSLIQDKEVSLDSFILSDVDIVSKLSDKELSLNSIVD